MKLRLTRLGFKAALFYGAVVFVHFAASYSNLFFLLLCFATSLGVVALAGTIRNLRGVEATVHAVPPVPAGETPRIEAAVTGDPVAATVEVRLAGNRRLEGPLPRGVHAVARVLLTSTWPLGLFRAVRELDPIGSIVVYPSPLAPGSAAGEGVPEDEGAPSPAEGLAQPSALREYRPGDPLRRIHWRGMARRGEPVVAEWEAGRAEGFDVVLDRRAEGEEFEILLRRVAGLAQVAKEEKAPFALHTQGHGETYGPGHESWEELWRFLAEAVSLPATAAAPPPIGTHAVRVGG